MEIEDEERDRIFNSIKTDLFQFESYSKAIAEIQEMCDNSPNDLEKMPGEIQELKRKQQVISSQIIDESTALKYLIGQEKQNMRKIEKKFQSINALKVKLLDVDAKLKSINTTEESAKACNEAGTEVKGALSAQYKIVMDKLMDARRNFPDIYKAVEAETGIHFFTPF